MDTNQKKNPMYSNTDTSKVVLSDDEWKCFEKVLKEAAGK